MSEFDDIRPYNGDEIPAAMKRIASDPAFPAVAAWLYPGRDVEEVKRKVAAISCVWDLQRVLMADVVKAVMDRSTDGFSFSGTEHLDPAKNYLFVSNHRDIVLDAMLHQLAVVLAGRDTAEITFGANLMSSQLLVDIGRSNKMFRVERPGLSISSPIEFYKMSMHLSEYIRYVITQKGQSVWIAQRNGRTKDGNDLTDRGIIKMFGMSLPEDKVRALAELNIAPVAISYEWEPCDFLKAFELYDSVGKSYVKKPGEDLNSILTGILEPKGHIHMQFCEPLRGEEYAALSGLSANQFCKEVAGIIDSRIHSAYRLTHNNYIAHDIKYGESRCSGLYSQEQKDAFVSRIAALQRSCGTRDAGELKKIFLDIYSNPVDSADN